MGRRATIGTGGETAFASLRQRLRDRTRSAHEALDAAMDLETRLADRSSCADLLVRFHSLYSTLAPAVDRLGLPFPQAQKLAWLETDLLCLGLTAETVRALPRSPLFVSIGDVGEAFGVLYVLEGATLGGQVIARRLEASLGVTAQTGGRFFAGHGAGVGANWRRFTAALDGYGETGADLAPVERAALAAFAAFQAVIGPSAAHDAATGGGARHVA